MVYIKSWHEYQSAAEALYTASPNKARYSIKWNSKEGQLVLKITDDATCLKFKTHSSVFLGRFESLNRSLMQKMTNARVPEPVALAPPQAHVEAPRAGTPVPVVPAAAATVAGGGTSKKKKKKKN
ncbi:signal recognition particle, SRP9/SRP14 subunit [Peniophora sp. CONT]|nr:signal recognition particle, SRP9/SRP14 subunit [Peniophora sp. CONT]